MREGQRPKVFRHETLGGLVAEVRGGRDEIAPLGDGMIDQNVGLKAGRLHCWPGRGPGKRKGQNGME